MWHEHDSPRRSSSKTSFVGFKCPLHTLSKSANLWGHSLSAAIYWRLHPPGVGPDKSSSRHFFFNFTRIFFGPPIFQMPPICSFVICNFSCQNAERRLIESCFFASSRVFGWLLFLSRFCLGILSHIQKSNMAMFGSKLASRLFKVKHLPNSGFPGIQWVDLLLSTRNWAMSRGAVVPCNCAEKQLVTPDLHAETNWLCWWVGLRIFFLIIFSLR